MRAFVLGVATLALSAGAASAQGCIPVTATHFMATATKLRLRSTIMQVQPRRHRSPRHRSRICRRRVAPHVARSKIRRRQP
jgi:hypothetical protein